MAATGVPSSFGSLLICCANGSAPTTVLLASVVARLRSFLKEFNSTRTVLKITGSAFVKRIMARPAPLSRQKNSAPREKQQHNSTVPENHAIHGLMRVIDEIRTRSGDRICRAWILKHRTVGLSALSAEATLWTS